MISPTTGFIVAHNVANVGLEANLILVICLTHFIWLLYLLDKLSSCGTNSSGDILGLLDIQVAIKVLDVD